MNFFINDALLICIEIENIILRKLNKVMNMVTDNITDRHVKELLGRHPELREASENLLRVYSILKICFFNQKNLFVCGNGGSAADSEHIVGELVKGFKSPRPLPEDIKTLFRQKTGTDELGEKLQMGLPCISLLSHPALSSAFSNDVDPLMVYAQQLFVFGKEGDAVMGLSTSGNAGNILYAFQVARTRGITTILFTGQNKGKCEEYADYVVKVPAKETYLVQEYHLPLYHCLCAMLEEAFYGK